MIEIEYIYKSIVTQKWMIARKSFDNVKKALRFLYAIKRAGGIVSGWSCDDPYDNEYLNQRFTQ